MTREADKGVRVQRHVPTITPPYCTQSRAQTNLRMLQLFLWILIIIQTTAMDLLLPTQLDPNCWGCKSSHLAISLTRSITVETWGGRMALGGMYLSNPDNSPASQHVPNWQFACSPARSTRYKSCFTVGLSCMTRFYIIVHILFYSILISLFFK